MALLPSAFSIFARGAIVVFIVLLLPSVLAEDVATPTENSSEKPKEVIEPATITPQPPVDPVQNESGDSTILPLSYISAELKKLDVPEMENTAVNMAYKYQPFGFSANSGLDDTETEPILRELVKFVSSSSDFDLANKIVAVWVSANVVAGRISQATAVKYVYSEDLFPASNRRDVFLILKTLYQSTNKEVYRSMRAFLKPKSLGGKTKFWKERTFNNTDVRLLSRLIAAKLKNLHVADKYDLFENEPEVTTEEQPAEKTSDNVPEPVDPNMPELNDMDMTKLMSQLPKGFVMPDKPPETKEELEALIRDLASKKWDEEPETQKKMKKIEFENLFVEQVMANLPPNAFA